MNHSLAKYTSFKLILLGIFLLALSLRIVYIFIVPHEPEPAMDDRHYYVMTAKQILQGNGILQNKAYAYQPPVFPLLEAGVFSVAGIDNITAVEITLAFFGALQCVLLALWASLLSTNRVGYIAGIWAATYPQFIRYPQTRYSEAFFIFLLALGFWLIIKALQKRSLANILFAGMICGIAALTREVAIFIGPVVACWFWFARKQMPSRWPGLLLAFAAGMILTIAPWTIRNWLVLHTFVPISTNGGINFYIGNSPRAEGRYNREDPFDWFVVSDVAWNDGANEVQANKRGFEEGLKYVKEYPGLALKRWALNGIYLWIPPSLSKAKSNSELFLRTGWLTFYLSMWVFGFYGIYQMGNKIRVVSFVLLAFVLMSLPYVLTIGESRYRLPVESIIIFYSAIGLDGIFRRYFEGDAACPLKLNPFNIDV